MNEAKAVNKDRLIADMKVVVSDAEELLRATASQAGSRSASPPASASSSGC